MCVYTYIVDERDVFVCVRELGFEFRGKSGPLWTACAYIFMAPINNGARLG